MKMSEAIRLGATMKPQHFGGIYDNYEKRSASCAMGAAIDAIGCPERDAGPDDVSTTGRGPRRGGETVVDIPAEWRLFTGRLQTCPACSWQHYGIELITHLNDGHRWTREQIADWVELHEALPVPEEAVEAEGQTEDARVGGRIE